jgi:hypothetical protein
MLHLKKERKQCKKCKKTIHIHSLTIDRHAMNWFGVQTLFASYVILVLVYGIVCMLTTHMENQK